MITLSVVNHTALVMFSGLNRLRLTLFDDPYSKKCTIISEKNIYKKITIHIKLDI